jgi:ribose transport system ATP-binding protein
MLEAKNISKQFSGVTALSSVSLILYSGKVTAIVGENGAGKSTLMKIFSGVHTKYEGEILFKGKPVRFSGTREAEETGIAIIHQELNLVPELSIMENIFLGREITNAFGLLDTKRMYETALSLLSRLHLQVDPRTKIAALRVGQQQLVEIAKALHANAEVIIMDEPTSAISDKEVEQLFAIITQLKSEGKTIAYISHKFKELFAIADHYIVLRDGASVGEGIMREATQDELIRKMTGRVINIKKETINRNHDECLLEVTNLNLRHPSLKSADIFKDISFKLYKGEILGVYGLMGAGRTEILETLFGLHAVDSSGEIRVRERSLKIKSPVDAISAGIALVPEDRKLQGLILNQSVTSNIGITVLKQLQRWGIMLDKGKEMALSSEYIKRLGIKTSSGKNTVRNLSGGNQQKIVIAKWLATNPGILLLDEPTRGIDINAKGEIYSLMKTLAEEGMGIIMVSSELPEILAVSDRVLVICEGTLTATLKVSATSEQEILKYAIHKNELIQ